MYGNVKLNCTHDLMQCTHGGKTQKKKKNKTDHDPSRLPYICSSSWCYVMENNGHTAKEK